ncbi:hypothetical protein [Hyphomicrobium sp. MC1]|uniref:hypothetical protein n=1 Tax=Hyphomicrobium sp. (strain MC1) TaxID=717785 RepID=UPI000213DA81|nr:hypothetical protein [Hyphomicrobium sp. MC1]CCB64422.1 protein of unknown function [Hyphomicrobium sp. MC1]
MESEDVVQADSGATDSSEKVTRADEQLPEVCSCISSDAIGLIRDLLTRNGVPVAAFIDDHVSNAIAQRNIIAEALRNIRNQIDAALDQAKVNFSNESVSDAVSLNQTTSLNPSE